MQIFNVYLNGKRIHSAFYPDNVEIDRETVRQQMINELGFSDKIRVTKGIQPARNKPKYEFTIEQFIAGYWNDVCTEDDIKEARQRLKEYRANQPQYPVRIRTERVKP